MPRENHTPSVTRVLSSLATAGLAFFLPRLVGAASTAPSRLSGDALALSDASLSAAQPPHLNSVVPLAGRKRAIPIATATQLITSTDTIVAQVSHRLTTTQGLTAYEIIKSDNTHQLIGQIFNLADRAPVGSTFLIASTDRDVPMQPTLADGGYLVYVQQEQANLNPQTTYVVKIDTQRTVSSKQALTVGLGDLYSDPAVTNFATSSVLTIYKDSQFGLVVTTFSSALVSNNDHKILASLGENGSAAKFSDGSALGVYESNTSPKTVYAKSIATDLTLGTELTIGANRQLPQAVTTTGDVAVILTLDDNGQNLYLVLKNKDGSEKRIEQRVNLELDTHPLSNHRIAVDPATGELAISWDREVATNKWVSVLRFADKDGNIKGNKEIETAQADNNGMPSLVPGVVQEQWVRTHCPDTTSVDIASYNSATIAPSAGVIADQQIAPDAAVNISIPKDTFVDQNVDHQDDLNYSVTLANDDALPTGYTVNTSGANIVIQHAGLSAGDVNFKVTATDLLGPKASASFRLSVGTLAETTTTTTQAGSSGQPASATSSPSTSAGTPQTGVATQQITQSPDAQGGFPIAEVITALAAVLVVVGGGATALYCFLRHRTGQEPSPSRMEMAQPQQQPPSASDAQAGEGATVDHAKYNEGNDKYVRKGNYHKFSPDDKRHFDAADANGAAGYTTARPADAPQRGEYDSVVLSLPSQYESPETALDLNAAASASTKGIYASPVQAAPTDVEYETLAPAPRVEYSALPADDPTAPPATQLSL